MATPSQPAPDPPARHASSLESTTVLLARLREGDNAAREQLVARYLPVLKRWAHGRLPGYARDLSDTDDLVQVTLIRALSRVVEFEPCREGAFLAYLRRILLNTVRNEIRRSMRRPGHQALDESLPDPTPSGVERAIGRETLEEYEAALTSLPQEQREAVILRLEFGYAHPEIAEALGKPSADAARMTVARGLIRLMEIMGARRA